MEGALVYLVLLDVSIGGEALELLKATVEAAVEGMPSTSLMGIVTFADTVHTHKHAGHHDACPQVPACNCH